MTTVFSALVKIDEHTPKPLQNIHEFKQNLPKLIYISLAEVKANTLLEALTINSV